VSWGSRPVTHPVPQTLAGFRGIERAPARLVHLVRRRREIAARLGRDRRRRHPLLLPAQYRVLDAVAAIRLAEDRRE
jgi:hypothetical protein